MHWQMTVFCGICGRRRYVRILERYLKQNLVSSGGLLEEVQYSCVIAPIFSCTIYSMTVSPRWSVLGRHKYMLKMQVCVVHDADSVGDLHI